MIMATEHLGIEVSAVVTKTKLLDTSSDIDTVSGSESSFVVKATHRLKNDNTTCSHFNRQSEQ